MSWGYWFCWNLTLRDCITAALHDDEIKTPCLERWSIFLLFLLVQINYYEASVVPHSCMSHTSSVQTCSDDHPYLIFHHIYNISLLCSSGLVAHSDLDERAIEALKEFNEEGALQVLVQFKESDLSHVQVSWITWKTKRSLLKCFLGQYVAFWHFLESDNSG